MTDFEKFKQLFSDIGICYEEKNNEYPELPELVIDTNILLDGHEVYISVIFSNEGKFDQFLPTGQSILNI